MELEKDEFRGVFPEFLRLHASRNPTSTKNARAEEREMTRCARVYSSVILRREESEAGKIVTRARRKVCMNNAPKREMGIFAFDAFHVVKMRREGVRLYAAVRKYYKNLVHYGKMISRYEIRGFVIVKNEMRGIKVIPRRGVPHNCVYFTRRIKANKIIFILCVMLILVDEISSDILSSAMFPQEILQTELKFQLSR